MTAQIAGIGTYVPETIVTNDDLAKIVETSDEWIVSRTGIRERRISTGMGTSELAAEAAGRALAAAGIRAEELDLIILGTSSPDCNYPSGACEVQAKIGAVRAVAFDVSAACAGFIYAMNIVQAFFRAGIYRTALIIGAETLSKVTDWTDRSTCVLFGDGAGAAVLRRSDDLEERPEDDGLPNVVCGNHTASAGMETSGADARGMHRGPGIIDMLMGSDGTKGDALTCTSRTLGNFLTGTRPESGFMTMDGQEVFKFAVKRVPESIETLLARNQIAKEEIRYYVLHQANERIVEAVARRLREPMEKFPMTIAKYGNTSTASIPLLLDDMLRRGMLRDGDRIVLSGFGAGMTWGAVLLEWGCRQQAEGAV